MPVEHQPLLLVQGRNLITGLALPALLTDPDGGLLFFNEAAGVLLGRTFEEVGRLPREQWARQFGPFDEAGRPLATDHPRWLTRCGKDAPHRAGSMCAWPRTTISARWR
jgi:PAS domain-containing protein